MMKRMDLMILIIITIIKRMSITLSFVLELMENIIELMYSVKTRTTEKVVRVFIGLITGKLVETLLDAKIITLIEVIRILEKCITLTNIVELITVWLIWIAIMIDTVFAENIALLKTLIATDIAIIIIVFVVIFLTTKVLKTAKDTLFANGLRSWKMQQYASILNTR